MPVQMDAQIDGLDHLILRLKYYRPTCEQEITNEIIASSNERFIFPHYFVLKVLIEPVTINVAAKMN